MRDSEFDFIRELVYGHSRIKLDEGKRALVAARLFKRLRANKLTDVGEYCQLLRSPEGAGERGSLIDAISTNHTFFFRESDHFDFVRDRVLPEMAARARTESWSRFHAWSAACSSGEEPYSLAMALASRLSGTGWPWYVEATDISQRVLAVARGALYREKSIAPRTPPWAAPYFQRSGLPPAGHFRVHPGLCATVGFRHLNLLEGRPPFHEPFQLIFCRNVMIYFDRVTQEELIGKLTAHLVPGGYLLVGHSESLAGVANQLEFVQPSIYRRPLPP